MVLRCDLTAHVAAGTYRDLPRLTQVPPWAMLGKGETWQYTLEVRGGGADGGFEGKVRDAAEIFAEIECRDRPMAALRARPEIQCGMYFSGISRVYLGHVSQVEAESAGHGVSQRAEIRGPGAPGVLLRQWQQLTTRVSAPPLS